MESKLSLKHYFLVIWIATVTTVVNGQDRAQLSDLLTNAGTRGYGASQSAIDTDLVDKLFGNPKGAPSQNNDPAITGSPDDRRKIVSGYKPPPPSKQKVDTRSRHCSDYASDGYACTNYLFCDENGEIITDGGPAISLRLGLRGSSVVNIEKEVENSKCPGSLEVCCRNPDYFEPVTEVVPPPPYQPKCGKRNTAGFGVRIQSDARQSDSTQFGEWPHMCLISERTKAGLAFRCGASLIHDSIVMTAAHCVAGSDPSKIIVRCGEWDTQQSNEPLPSQDRKLSHITVHPEFNPKSLTNNIALLFMDKPFELVENVDTMCLPSVSLGRNSYEHRDCYATGWGKDRFNTGDYQVIMKQIRLEISDDRQCENSLKAVLKNTFFKLDKTAVCAGGIVGEDTCTGDGGGPLVCPTGKTYIDEFGVKYPLYSQAGIVGWGVECGLNVPGVYTDVSTQLCFIEWAAKCNFKSNELFKDLACGSDWAIKQRENAANQFRLWESRLQSVSENTRPRIEKRMNTYLDTTLKWDNEIDRCSGSSGASPGGYDLSGFQRSNVD